MKSPPLLPLVALVFAVAYACTDSSAPAKSHSLMAPIELGGDLGKPPPPPVSTVISVEIQSPGSAIFTGVFFNNGELTPDGDPIPTFDGTAWLRFDNNQPDMGFLSGTVSANARFMARDMNFSGSGTLYIAGQAYKITAVDLFIPFEACGFEEPGVPPSPCAIIDFRAVDQNGVQHTGQAQAFDRADCLQENKKGDLVFVCETEPPPPPIG